jgi:hypothetical protein
MRILVTTEREEAEVNVTQAHKEAQVGTTAFTGFVFIARESSTCGLQTRAVQRNVHFKLVNAYRNSEN